ncbi:hypothetical protein L917_08610 [Phytophthora nicotianae]|uniref:Chromo domain-containing protein n=1 Tax=Phytophthora nicotianae TaxID=4792 RepID=W2L6Y5_PHYNI|nr:hypothetical protein L917_08610 [Phytophthora nicotianae]
MKRLNPTFNVELLSHYLTNTTDFPNRPIPKAVPLILDDDTGEELYIIERLIKRRTRRHKREWLVQWHGLPRHEATWEREADIKHVPHWRLGDDKGIKKVVKDTKLIDSFLRLAVKDPRRPDKARHDLYNSISKSNRILEALRRDIKTNLGERPKEKKAILAELEATKKELLKAQYRVSVSVQTRLREIEIPVPDWVEKETQGKKRLRSTSSTSSRKAKTSNKE